MDLFTDKPYREKQGKWHNAVTAHKYTGNTSLSHQTEHNRFYLASFLSICTASPIDCITYITPCMNPVFCCPHAPWWLHHSTPPPPPPPRLQEHTPLPVDCYLSHRDWMCSCLATTTSTTFVVTALEETSLYYTHTGRTVA